MAVAIFVKPCQAAFWAGGTFFYYFFINLVELSNIFSKNGGQKIQKLNLYGIPGTLAEQNIKI